MTWERLDNRLHRLPLILAGPILRHTDLDSVTVWVALKESRTVTLRVYRGSGAARAEILTGQRTTARLGEHLHVVAVTAAPVGSDGIKDFETYYYDLDFGGGERLASPGVLNEPLAANPISITYGDADLPSFALPPTDLSKVRLVHGSCRKAHAPSLDALPAIDIMIEAAATTALSEVQFAERRPHQLYLTGDQIYADDVADALLEMLTEAGDTMLGWKEPLPDLGGKKPEDLKPGTRAETTLTVANFTSGVPNKKYPKSHLLGLGEFYAMYLFAWSNVPWPATLPETGSDEERRNVENFRATLPQVRRALANVPTYMIFDDHEITDDWYMNRDWCARAHHPTLQVAGGALDKPLGRRVIQNGLLAYAVFQAWGNTPSQFRLTGAAGEPGRDLLSAVAQWKGDANDPSLVAIAKRVGLPIHALTPDETVLTRDAGSLRWDYRVAVPGRSYEVLVLDCRTARFYPKAGVHAGLTAPGLLSAAAFADQIDNHPPQVDDGVTLVVSQTPVLGIPFIEEQQREAWGLATWENDAEAWNLDQVAFQRLLARLVTRRTRVAVLAGDVHYGFVARMNYWARHPFEQTAQETKRVGVIAQLNSSALKNETTSPPFTNTTRLHVGGFNQFYGIKLVPELEDVAGWNTKPEKGEITIGTQGKGLLFWRKIVAYTLMTTPALLPLTDRPRDTVICKDEDWRYQIRYMKGTKPPSTNPSFPPLTQVPTDPKAAAVAIKDLHKRFKKQLENDEGTDIVGKNNLGELSFSWLSGAAGSVKQVLWWRPTKSSAPLPITTYEISLDPSEPAEPAGISQPCP